MLLSEKYFDYLINNLYLIIFFNYLNNIKDFKYIIIYTNIQYDIRIVPNFQININLDENLHTFEVHYNYLLYGSYKYTF